MYLVESKMSLITLLAAAAVKKLPGYADDSLNVCYIEPDKNVEIFDRLLTLNVYDPIFVAAEYKGLKPRYVCDRRRYSKRFENLMSNGDSIITFASSDYRLEPVSVILESRRTGDFEGPHSISFRLIVCDTENRLGLPAALSAELSQLEESQRQEIPEEVKREVAKIGA